MSIQCHAKVLRNPNSGSIIRVLVKHSWIVIFSLFWFFGRDFCFFGFRRYNFRLRVCRTRVSLVSYRSIFTQGTPLFVIVPDAIMSSILLELFVYKVILLHLQYRLAYRSEEALWIKDNVHRKIAKILHGSLQILWVFFTFQQPPLLFRLVWGMCIDGNKDG